MHRQRVGEAEHDVAPAGLGRLAGRRHRQRAGHDRDPEPERGEHHQVRGLVQLERRRCLEAGPAQRRVDVPADAGARGELDQPPPAEQVRDGDGTDEPVRQLL
jgi:hypothetical protein